MAVDYGTDVAGYTDIDGSGMMISGRMVLIHALIRRLSTPRGRLIGAPNYGLDLMSYCNDDMSAADIGELQAAVASECEKDERVESAACSIAYDAASKTMTVTIGITDGAGPFPLVLAVSAVSITLMSGG